MGDHRCGPPGQDERTRLLPEKGMDARRATGDRWLRQQNLRVQPIAAVSQFRCLGVLLCYNDGDLLDESISYLLEQNHDLVVWDHGSTDDTPAVLERFRRHCREIQRVPREFDFYELYQAMSRHLIESYV